LLAITSVPHQTFRRAPRLTPRTPDPLPAPQLHAPTTAHRPPATGPGPGPGPCPGSASGARAPSQRAPSPRPSMVPASGPACQWRQRHRSSGAPTDLSVFVGAIGTLKSAARPPGRPPPRGHRTAPHRPITAEISRSAETNQAFRDGFSSAERGISAKTEVFGSDEVSVIKVLGLRWPEARTAARGRGHSGGRRPGTLGWPAGGDSGVAGGLGRGLLLGFGGLRSIWGDGRLVLGAVAGGA
jgi:hypothetical protein